MKARITKTVIIYVVGGFGILQAIDFFSNKYNWPSVIFEVVLALTISGLPFTIIRNSFHEHWSELKVLRKEGFFLFLNLLLTISLISFFAIKPTHPHSRELIEKSIAVLPFADLSPTHDQEYFGIGMMDEILNHLIKIGDLSPVSRTSSIIYSKSGKTVQEIANELGVANILEGSISKSENKFKITVQLTDAKNDRLLWSESYNPDISDIFAIQSEVAQKVAHMLSARISAEVKNRIEAIPTKNQEAYDLFLKAHAKWWGEEDTSPILEQVIKLDSNFSQAYSDLAFRWFVKGYWAGNEDPSLVKKKFSGLIHKALQLDPNNSDAHLVKFDLHLFYELNFDSAYYELEKTAELNPSRSDLGQAYQLILCATKRFKESLNKSQFYFERDKNYPSNWVGLANSYFYAGQPKKAVETLEAVTKFLKERLYTENEVLVQLGQLKIFTRDYKGALNIYKPLLDSGKSYPLYYGYAGIAYAHLGQKPMAKKIVNELIQKRDNSSLGSPCYFAAAVYVALNQKEEALTLLEKAYQNHEMELLWLNVIPIFDPLRGNPRFEAILKKLGFQK